jgi:hypothetical protein
MKYIVPFLVVWILNIHLIQAETNNNTFKFDGISGIKLEKMEADIQFILGSSSQIIIIIDDEGRLTMTSKDGVLNINKTSRSKNPLRFRIVIPSECKLDINVDGKSHVFIPSTSAPLRITATDLAQVTIDGCTGLILTQSSFTKTQVLQLKGNISATLSDQSELGIQQGAIATALLTATESTHVSIAALIQSLKLTTKGDARIQVGTITDTFMWVGRGNERIYIKNLTGVADVTANYDSRLTVENANLDTLLAATSSTGKIKISGKIKNAAMSTRGASEIVVDKVTGKILRKNQSNRGIIKILNP